MRGKVVPMVEPPFIHFHLTKSNNWNSAPHILSPISSENECILYLIPDTRLVMG